MTARPDADLRDALETAALPAGLVLDTTAVLERGHRTVRRRRVLRTAVVAAAVVAVGVAVGLAGARSGSQRAVPAAPSDRPATTLDIRGADARVVPAVRKIEVAYDAARHTGSFAIDWVNRPGATVDVVLDPTIGAGFTVVGAGTDHRVLLMLVPPAMDAQPWPRPRAADGLWTAAADVAGADLLAMARSLAPGDPVPQTLYRTEPARGAVFGDGSRVDTARVALGPAEVVVWLNPSHRVWGHAELVDGQPTSLGDGDLVEPLDAGFLRLDGSADGQDAAGNPVWTTTGTGLLPSGATQVTPRFRAGRPSGLAFGSAVMTGDGRVALAVRCTAAAAEEVSSDALCQELEGVGWVDRAGTRHFTPFL